MTLPFLARSGTFFQHVPRTHPTLSHSLMRKPRQSQDESSLTLALRGDGAMRIKPLGARRWHPSDIYHQLLTLTWPQLIALFVATFLSFNLLFAFLYGLDPQGISWGDTRVNAAPYWRAFFFSIDTVATIG